MNPSRLWLLGAVAAIAAILAAAIGLGVQPALASAAAADASTAQAEQATAASGLRLAHLAKAAAKQSDLETQNSLYGSAVTSSLRMNTFSRQVRNTAALDGVQVTALSVSNPLVYVPVVAAPVAAAATPSASASPAPAAAAPATAADSSGVFGKTDPLITGADFTVIPVTLTVSGGEAASIAFAQDLQHMSRLFAVDTVTYAKGNQGTPPATTISGNIYALKR
ncbi:hypothetical protein [Amnibacterium kyonggiense]